MTETQFLEQAERVLAAIDLALTQLGERADLDLDIARTGPVLTVDLPNGTKLVINTQAAVQQLWVAARSGGYHYALGADGLWRDTRDGSELFAALSALLTAQSGVPIQIQKI